MTNPTMLERQLEASVTEVQDKRLAKATPNALARPQESGIGVDELVARVTKVREVQSRVMKNGHHYGQVPGIEKPTLLKPGAELLGMTFQLDAQFAAVDRWDGEHLECVVTCTVYHAPTQTRLGSGVGSCSTKEKKYAWRGGGRKCPECGSATALLKSKDKPEWFCWRKKDGCGATFPEKDPRITSQSASRVPNPDIADQYNTVRKLACKRAHVAAILFVTCASEIFTQDVEDSHGESFDNGNTYSDEDRHAAPVESPEFDAVMKLMTSIESEIKSARTVTYEDLLRWRSIFGSKGHPTKLVGVPIRNIYDSLAPSQRDDLGKLSNRVERQLKRYEGIVQAPGPEGSFDDGDEPEPGSDG